MLFEKNQNTVGGRVVELERLVMLYFSTLQKASWGPYGPQQNGLQKVQ